MSEVLIKDRKKEIEYIRIALCMAEIHIDYQIADLINRVLKELDKQKGEFKIDDSIKILYNMKFGISFLVKTIFNKNNA